MLLGLSGAILVWESEWIRVPGASDPLVENVAKIADITESVAAKGNLVGITFASDDFGLHQLTYADGSGAYVRQDGTVVESWTSQWERPELWLFDLHHHLFSGEIGEVLSGIIGIAGILFVLTGVILWWRGRRGFRFRLWPERLAPGPIVRHHRDLGIVTAPLLVISMLSGVMILFAPIRFAMIGEEHRPKIERAGTSVSGPADALVAAKAMFPGAVLRRISLPASPGGPLIVRMRQPFEWTPNGRTQLAFAANGIVTVQDAAAANRQAWLSEKLYPIHSAKVGGWTWKLAMTASGLALSLLGSLTVWSFWARRATRRKARRLGRNFAPLRH
jgi:uncharacterized iron-regulated membrane protein